MTAPRPDGLTVITTHLNADFDALASMLAATLLYPGAVAAFPGSQEKGLRDFFVLSASYMMNLKRPKDVDLDQVTRLVLVDCRQKDRLGRLGQLLENGRRVEVHVYDHHPPTAEDIQGDLSVIEETGACTTILTRLLLERGIEPSPDQATLLALGIYEDTGAFTFSSTTPADLVAAAELLKRGANLNTVSNLIVRELDAHQVGLLHDLLQHLEVLRLGGVEVAIATCSADVYSPDFAVVAHKLVEMENLSVLFALARMEDRVHLVARSRLAQVDVGRVATALGGGGHPFAASATVKDQTLIEVRQSLLAALESQLAPGRTAREIMSFPVISVPPAAPLAQASEILNRYNVNMLPVMDEGSLLGLISRQVVEKAIFHHLGAVPVSDFMNPEMITIPPEATLNEIQERIVGRRQRILPVVDQGQVVGVVTRTDLLNILIDEEPLPDVLYQDKEAKSYLRNKNLEALLEERLPTGIVGLLRDLGAVGDELGYNVYVVGGFVRDLFLRRSNLDIDVVVEGDGIRFANEYGRRVGARVRDHAKFGTAVVVLQNGFKLDVATARLEYYESPASLPIVELSSLKLDLYRRDFTINTMALKLNKSQFGVLIDYFGAQRDLKEKAIRVLHSLSFVEDPTRCLRAVRFEQRFSFKIGKQTRNLITNAIKRNAFAHVNPRRLWLELTHILEEPNPATILGRLHELGLWKAIHPALAFTEEVEQRIYHVRTVLSWFDLLYLGDRYARWIVFFLALTDHLREREINQILDQLAVSEKHRSLIHEARIWSGRILRSLERRPGMRPSSLVYLFDQAPLEGQLWTMAKGEGDLVRRAFSAYFTEYKRITPLINGHDLQQLGFKPGPIFSRILKAVREARLNGWVKTLEDEIDFIFRRFGQQRKI